MPTVLMTVPVVKAVTPRVAAMAAIAAPAMAAQPTVAETPMAVILATADR
jgi:hypothetical protein